MSNINSKWGDWAKAPTALSPKDAARVLSADVVIVGAGISGVACALKAAQSGAKVIVIEKNVNWSARGGNIGVASSSFMKSRGYENDIDMLCREWIKRCGNRCDEKLVRLFLTKSGEAMDWLIEILTSPDYNARPELQGSLYRGETYYEYPGSHRFFDGPMAKKGMRAGAADAVYAMYSEALKLGAEYLFKTKAEQLIKKDGRVTGVMAISGEEYIYIEAKLGVVLATGDIGGNEEMCEDLAPLANKCANVYSPKGGNMGDGHRMGLWAGGAFEETPFPIMIHTQAYHFANYCFLFVRPDGTRFMNEDSYVQGKCLAILRQGDSFGWSIVDSAWREKIPATLPYGGGLFWDHDHALDTESFSIETEEKMFQWGINRGVIVSADTPEELAEKMEIPKETFVNTFNRYNEMTKKGRDEDFGKRKELLIPLDKPPFYALKFGPAVLVVLGGLRVDTSLNVLNEAGKPIDGLYAVGNVMGGRYGVDYPLVIVGNSHGTALTFGYLLGKGLSGKLASHRGNNI